MSEPSDPTDGPSPSEIPVPTIDAAAKAATKKLKQLATTPSEDIRTDIVQAIGEAKPDTSTQNTIRLYTVCSYVAKVALGAIGAYKLSLLIQLVSTVGLTFP